MEIKLYFAETPEHWLNNDALTEVWKGLFEKLQETYPHHSFTKKCSNQHSYENGITHQHFPNRKFGFYQCIIENQKNGKYILVNYFDSITALHKHNGWDLHNLVDIVTTPGVHLNNLNFEKSSLKHTPASYIFHSADQNDYLKNFHSKPKTIDGLHFRGKTYLFRKYLENDDRYTILDTSNGKNGIGNKNFLDELSSLKISLCLNGTAEITYRDIESFAVKTPVLRPTLTCEFHNKLIPNKHYIAVNLDNIKYKSGLEYYKAKADKIYKRYLEVKDDKDYLNFVSTKAHEWFLKNATIESNIDILLKVIDLNKLK